jgi:ubiquitin-protein ligase
MNKELIKLNRIEMEKKIFQEDIKYYEDNGIYLEYDKNDTNIVYILYIVKHDNIYKHSQHLFKFIYSNNYPFDPPNLVYLSSRKKARLHPNFYANGKCCLSLLGTWNGPQWTSCNNITSIINSIIPLFTDNPIQYEPSFNDIEKHKIINEKYNKYISYEIIRLLIYNLNNPMEYKLDNLYKIMNNYYLDNIKDIKKKIEKFKNSNYNLQTPIYNYNININYENLINDYNKLNNKLKLI